MRKWIIFRCHKDDCWIVSVLKGDRAQGVADCPDESTAVAVMDAMRARDKVKTITLPESPS